MNIKQKPCKHCGVVYHFSFQCPTRAKPLKQRKPIKKIGKVTKKWLEVRKEWLRLHPQEHFQCTYCPKIVPRNEITLDHYKNRSAHPELRFDLNNLVPACAPCNYEKGSIDGDVFIKRYKEG